MKVLGFLYFISQAASISQNVMGVDESQIKLKLPLWCERQNTTVPYTIMRDFLVSSTSDNVSVGAAEAAANLTRNLPTGNYSTDDEYLFRSPYFYVMTIFGTVHDIATQIPAGHMYHYRLAALVAALKDQPQPEPEVGQMICSEWPFHCSEFRWHDLPSFSFEHASQFSYRSRFEPWTTQEGPSDCWTSAQWLNLNKFISVLVAEEIVEIQTWFPTSGLLVLWHTLEFRRSVHDLEDNIPSAATWILTAGKWMRRHREAVMQIPWVALDDAIQEYDGPQVGFNDERWQFWTSKFRDLSMRADLTVKAKLWAQNAADHMASLESPSSEDKLDL